MSEITISSELLQISPEVQDAINSKNLLLLSSQQLSHMVCLFLRMLRRLLKSKKLYVNTEQYQPPLPLLAV